MSCNSESRRAINYSLQEPINNKYDLWLSENLRYNSEGSLIYDSPGQPACDLILKIYKDGDWKPIAGLSTEHIVANKINIVDGVNYTYISPNDNTLHINNGFQQNHLPLFRNPQDSPNELFDAGTLGNAIYGFVNETEWTNIFEGDAFNNSFKLYFPTIISGGDININDFIELANTEQIGGIKAAQDPNTADDCRNIPIVLAGPTVGSVWGLPFGNGTYPGDSDYDTEYLYLPGWALMEWMKNPYFNQQNPQLFITGWKGVDTQLRENSDLIWVGLSGVTPENANRFCIVRADNTDPSGATIDWVDLSDYGIYPVLSNNSSENIEYVINGGGKEGTYLDYNGEWTVPDKNVYHGVNLIDIDNQSGIYIKSYNGPDTRPMYISSTNGSTPSWTPLPEIPEPIQYSGNSPIVVDNTNNTISISGSTDSNDVLCSDGEGGVEWRNIQSGEEYDAGDGIKITTPQLGNKIIKGNIKECDLNGYNSGFNASTSIEFRAPGGLSVIKEVVTLNIDGGSLNGGSTYDLSPYTYTKINLAMNGTIDFIIDGQTSYVNGNPIYVILSIPTKTCATYTINIKDSLNNDSNDFISIDNALVNGNSSYTFGCDVTKFLITMQFGIVKIEPLGYIESDGTEPESEE